MSDPIYIPNRAAWESPVEIPGSGRRLYPIDNDPGAYQIVKAYVVHPDYYQAQDIGTPINDDGTLLYLSSERITNRTPAFIYFERTYTAIPAARVEYESYPFTIPGLAASSTFGTAVTVTVAFPSSYGKMRFTIGTHGFTTSDLLKLDLKLRLGLSYTSTFQLYEKPTAVTTNTVTFDWNYLDYDFVSGTVRSADVRPPRIPITRSVTSRIDYDYVLPGTTPGYETGDDITTPDPFVITNTDNEQTDTLSATTLPTQSDYEDSIDDGEWLVAESYVRRWQGNIYERLVRTVRAQ